MKYLIYFSAIILILTIFSNVEAKKNKKIPFFRKKLPRQSMSSGRSSFSSNSNFGSSSFGSSSFGGRSSSSYGSSFGSRSMLRDPTPSEDEKKKKSQSQSQTAMAKGPKYDHSNPKGVTYGPRGGRPGVVSGTRYIQGRRPIAYGYYTGRFPVWLTSYAVIMDTLEECPPFKFNEEHTEKFVFAERSPLYEKCRTICDKNHCIQTRDFCCYYVEPQKMVAIKAQR